MHLAKALSQGNGRRKSDPSNWKKNKNKYARHHGKQHLSASGKVILAKKLRRGCQNCRFSCHRKFTRQQRQKIFDDFYKLDASAQRLHLISQRSEVISTRKSDPARKRAPNYQWHVQGKRVCYNWMSSTYGYSKGRLRELKEEDKRGLLLSCFFLISPSV